RDGQGERVLAVREGIFLRRRYLQYSEGAHGGALCEVEAARTYLVVHIARDHRLRDAEGNARGGVPFAYRGLRIWRSADSEEYKERCDRGARTAVHKRRAQAWASHSWRLHSWSARRNPRDHSKHDRVCQGAGC